MTRDDRGQSIAINHVLAVAITTVLLVTLFASVGSFVDGQMKQAGEQELETIGQRLAAEVQVADRMARRGGEVSLEVTQPPKVTTGAYSVQLLTGSDCDADHFTAQTCLRLQTQTQPVSVKVPVVNATTIDVRSVGPGTFVVVANPGGGTTVPGEDVTADVGLGLGVGDDVVVPPNDVNFTLQNRPPLAQFTFSPGSPSVQSDIRFNATGGDPDGEIASYEWDLDGDGSVEKTGETFNYSYGSPGKYNASLTVTDAEGKTDTTSKTVIVAGVVYNYDAAAHDYDGDGIPGGVNFSVTSHHGTATITHVSVEPHDDDLAEIRVSSGSPPSGDHEMYIDPEFHSDWSTDDTIDLTDDGVIVDMSAHGNHVTIDGGEDATLTLSEFREAAGDVNMSGVPVDVTVRYYVQSNGTEHYYVNEFTLFSNWSGNRPPEPDFNATCSGTECAFNASASTDPDGSLTDYNWTFGDGGTATGKTRNHTYPANGTYQVSLTVTDDNGTSASVTKTVYVGSVNFDLKVNFQPNTSTTPPGYEPDTGGVYGPRGNGYTYGWNAPADETRDRGAVADQRLDTLTHVDEEKYGSDRTWEVAVPDGTYRVYVVMGDPSYTDQENVVDVEGQVIEDPDGQDNFDAYMAVVEVSDGRLTIRPGSGSDNAKMSFVHVRQVDPRPYDEEGGRVVMEAETPMDVRQGNGADVGGDDMSGYSFVPSEDSAATGDRALYATPDTGASAAETKNGQRLDYEVDFDTTGTYYVHVRMKCPSGSWWNDNDAINVGLDGSFGDGVSRAGLTYPCNDDYRWVSYGYEWSGFGWQTTPVTVDVSSTGVHTVSIWMREDGVYVDKIVLTKDPSFPSDPDGEGPDESERA